MLSFAVRPLAPLTPLVVPFGTAAGAILFFCGERMEGYSVVWGMEEFLADCVVSRCMADSLMAKRFLGFLREVLRKYLAEPETRI